MASSRPPAIHTMTAVEVQVTSPVTPTQHSPPQTIVSPSSRRLSKITGSWGKHAEERELSVTVFKQKRFIMHFADRAMEKKFRVWYFKKYERHLRRVFYVLLVSVTVFIVRLFWNELPAAHTFNIAGCSACVALTLLLGIPIYTKHFARVWQPLVLSWGLLWGFAVFALAGIEQFFGAQKVSGFLEVMLPPSVISRLLAHNVVADEFSDVTVLFAEIDDFLTISESFTPQEVVDSLNHVYSLIQELLAETTIYQVESMGEQALLISGCPVPEDDHAGMMARFALNLIECSTDILWPDGTRMILRVGMHSGSVMASVIGRRRPQYNIIGDSVNTAARMLSKCEAGHVRVSSVTRQLLERNFELVSAGVQEFKGKGRMETFNLIGEKIESSSQSALDAPLRPRSPASLSPSRGVRVAPAPISACIGVPTANGRRPSDQGAVSQSSFSRQSSRPSSRPSSASVVSFLDQLPQFREVYANLEARGPSTSGSRGPGSRGPGTSKSHGPFDHNEGHEPPRGPTSTGVVTAHAAARTPELTPVLGAPFTGGSSRAGSFRRAESFGGATGAAAANGSGVQVRGDGGGVGRPIGARTISVVPSPGPAHRMSLTQAVEVAELDDVVEVQEEQLPDIFDPSHEMDEDELVFQEDSVLYTNFAHLRFRSPLLEAAYNEFSSDQTRKAMRKCYAAVGVMYSISTPFILFYDDFFVLMFIVRAVTTAWAVLGYGLSFYSRFFVFARPKMVLFGAWNAVYAIYEHAWFSQLPDASTCEMTSTRWMAALAIVMIFFELNGLSFRSSVASALLIAGGLVTGAFTSCQAETRYTLYEGMSYLIMGFPFCLLAKYSSDRKRRESYILARRAECEKMLMNDLVENILPVHASKCLLAGRPLPVQTYEDVTLLFSDIVGFTSISSILTPYEIRTVLHTLYKCFDDLCEKYGVYKVATIGDAYIAAAGCPEECDDHALRVINLAFGMQEAIKLIRHPKIAQFQMRIGIHSGSVFAGLTGTRTPHFHLFGPACHIAHMLEASAPPSAILVSDTTIDLLPPDAYVVPPSASSVAVRDAHARCVARPTSANCARASLHSLIAPSHSQRARSRSVNASLTPVWQAGSHSGGGGGGGGVGGSPSNVSPFRLGPRQTLPKELEVSSFSNSPVSAHGAGSARRNPPSSGSGGGYGLPKQLFISAMLFEGSSPLAREGEGGVAAAPSVGSVGGGGGGDGNGSGSRDASVGGSEARSSSEEGGGGGGGTRSVSRHTSVSNQRLSTYVEEGEGGGSRNKSASRHTSVGSREESGGGGGNKSESRHTSVGSREESGGGGGTRRSSDNTDDGGGNNNTSSIGGGRSNKNSSSSGSNNNSGGGRSNKNSSSSGSNNNSGGGGGGSNKDNNNSSSSGGGGDNNHNNHNNSSSSNNRAPCLDGHPSPHTAATGTISTANTALPSTTTAAATTTKTFVLNVAAVTNVPSSDSARSGRIRLGSADSATTNSTVTMPALGKPSIDVDKLLGGIPTLSN